ncbi:ribosomal protein S18 acetylase RimI-like enzyme [Massilia aurea]|uniref:Ribosomal protein S18 acetylase RimI-like enzyme n=1 Tax=Massilia aurea TaxID=373040 RepID=A0A7W9U6Z6_9BURK|nr:GNAT family N-acetyltransferase [Massilia aurea]MBB6132742.1 ribosomal protein S18 acetylase RimI-like enzyme [Massilia aurea]
MTLSTLHIRDAGAADEAFFASLYRSTRDDLLALPADPSVIDGLIAMQHRLQVAGYRNSYPQAVYQVLERDGVAVGRLVTAAADGVIRVVDIAVLPSARRTGLAVDVLRRLQAQAAGARHAVALSVRQDNVAARHLYEALGFAVDSEDTMRLELHWRAQTGVQPPADSSWADT